MSFYFTILLYHKTKICNAYNHLDETYEATKQEVNMVAPIVGLLNQYLLEIAK